MLSPKNKTRNTKTGRKKNTRKAESRRTRSQRTHWTASPRNRKSAAAFVQVVFIWRSAAMLNWLRHSQWHTFGQGRGTRSGTGEQWWSRHHFPSYQAGFYAFTALPIRCRALNQYLGKNLAILWYSDIARFFQIRKNLAIAWNYISWFYHR